jgi:hypothetical protein
VVREVGFLGATVLAAALVHVFPPVFGWSAAMITAGFIGYGIYSDRAKLKRADLNCLAVAALAAGVALMLPALSKSFYVVAGLMLLRFIVQYVTVGRVGKETSSIAMRAEENNRQSTETRQEELIASLHAEVGRLREQQGAYVTQEEINRQLSELRAFSHDRQADYRRSIEEETRKKIHDVEAHLSLSAEEKNREVQSLKEQQARLIERMTRESEAETARYQAEFEAKKKENEALRSQNAAQEEALRIANVEKEKAHAANEAIQRKLREAEQEKQIKESVVAELKQKIQRQDAQSRQMSAAYQSELAREQQEKAVVEAELERLRQEIVATEAKPEQEAPAAQPAPQKPKQEENTEVYL